jgi:biotin transport system permease protein
VGLKPGWRERVIGLDPRLKILLVLGLGVLTWRAGGTGVACYLTFALLAAAATFARGVHGKRQLKMLALVVLSWTGLKAGFELLDGAAWGEAGAESLLLGGRLLVLVLLGLALTAATSTRQLGLAAGWFLRPVLGRRSWRAALGLALMVHFLPLTLRTLQQVNTTIRLRGQQLALPHRLGLLVKTTLRALSRKTWDQTVALAVRGLDREEMWRMRRPLEPAEWSAGAVLLGAACLVSLI